MPLARPKLAQYYFASLILGLEYAQKYCGKDNVFMHRDLKAENLLITGDGRLKIADFDTAKVIPKDTRTDTFNGTRGYISPERYMYNRLHDDTADLWSIGTLLFIFLNGHPAYGKIRDIIPRISPDTMSPEQEKKYIQRSVESYIQRATTGRWHLRGNEEKGYKDLDQNGVSHEARLAGDLMRKLLKFNPNERLPLAEVKAHPYLKDFQWPAEGEPLPTPVQLGLITEDELNRIAPLETA